MATLGRFDRADIHLAPKKHIYHRIVALIAILLHTAIDESFLVGVRPVHPFIFVMI